jgi:hypothetical protein
LANRLIISAKSATHRIVFGSSKNYAENVNCAVVTFVPTVVTKTKAGKTLTITAPTPITILTKKVTSTVTSTKFPPDITVRVTSTLESTILVTTIPIISSTTTTTLTNTINLVEATEYAQCSHVNFANFYGPNNGEYITDLEPADTSLALTVSSVSATSAYDCCVQCAEDATCNVGYYADSSSGSFCELGNIAGSICTLDSPCQWIAAAAGTSDNGLFFNGAVGRVTSATT